MYIPVILTSSVLNQSDNCTIYFPHAYQITIIPLRSLEMMQSNVFVHQCCKAMSFNFAQSKFKCRVSMYG